MKIEGPKPELLSALTAVSGIIPTNAQICTEVGVFVTGGEARFWTCNGSAWAFCSRPALTINGPDGVYPLPSMAGQWLAMNPGITASIEFKGQKVHVSCGSNKIVLTAPDKLVFDLPKCEPPDHAISCELSQARAVIKYIAGSERPELNGVYIDKLGDDYVAFAGDGKTLGVTKLVGTGKASLPIILSKQIMECIPYGPCSIAQDEKLVYINSEHIGIIAARAAVSPIPWQRTITSIVRSGTCKVDKEEFQQAVLSCHCLRSANKFAMVDMVRSADGITLKTSTGLGQYEKEIGCRIRGNYTEDKLLPTDNLLAYLQRSKAEVIELTFTPTGAPLIINDGEVEFFVVPMRLK